MQPATFLADDRPQTLDLERTAYPSRLRVLGGPLALTLEPDATHYLFVRAGSVEIVLPTGRFPVTTGMYAALPGSIELAGDANGFVVSRVGYAGLFTLGGPLESAGRLRYIDGCTDTLLLSPPVLGDPCLNHLHIPPGTHQTEHDHPTWRVGTIAAGEGYCETPVGPFPLRPGTVFVLEPGALHSFHTPPESSLTVLAWHPDSDVGPTDDSHPMVNRTMVAGVSARDIAEIRTR